MNGSGSYHGRRIYFGFDENGNLIQLQPVTNCSHEIELQKEIVCERCYNKLLGTEKIFPVNPKTFCVPCAKKYKALMAFTEE